MWLEFSDAIYYILHKINGKLRLKKGIIGIIQTDLVIVLVFYSRYCVVLECPGVFLNK